jgi:kynureninase
MLFLQESHNKRSQNYQYHWWSRDKRFALYYSAASNKTL